MHQLQPPAGVREAGSGIDGRGVYRSGRVRLRVLVPQCALRTFAIVDAGKPDQYPLGSVTQDLQSGIYVVHGPEGIYAMSAVCTHLGCLTAWNPDLGIVACPCHGSKFTRDGTKIEGPAPRPLVWLRTSLSDEGDLLVDRSAPLERKEFVRI